MYSDVNLLGLLFFVSEIKRTVGAKGGRVPHHLLGGPVFGRSVNSISTRGGRLCPPHYYVPPGSSALPTSLKYLTKLLTSPVSLSEKTTNRNYFYVYSK